MIAPWISRARTRVLRAVTILVAVPLVAAGCTATYDDASPAQGEDSATATIAPQPVPEPGDGRDDRALSDAEELSGVEGHDPQEPQPQTRIIRPVSSPIPPGTAIDVSAQIPQPGEYFNYNICTVAYSFTAESGTAYAITASHCGREGDLAWAGSADNSFQFPAEPIGRFIYSDLYNVNSSDLDVAVIELNGNYPTWYSPNPMETAVAERLEYLPEQVCKTGRISEETCGTTTGAQSMGKLNTQDGTTLDSRSARAELCAVTGDSGGPVYATVNGETVIVGLVSGTTTQHSEANCGDSAEPMSVSFTPATEFQHIVSAVVPDAALARDSW